MLKEMFWVFSRLSISEREAMHEQLLRDFVKVNASLHKINLQKLTFFGDEESWKNEKTLHMHLCTFGKQNINR